MNRPLLTMRSALVLLLGVLVGVGAGALASWSGAADHARAVLVGGTAFAGAVAFFNSIIGDVE